MCHPEIYFYHVSSGKEQIIEIASRSSLLLYTFGEKYDRISKSNNLPRTKWLYIIVYCWHLAGTIIPMIINIAIQSFSPEIASGKSMFSVSALFKVFEMRCWSVYFSRYFPFAWLSYGWWRNPRPQESQICYLSSILQSSFHWGIVHFERMRGEGKKKERKRRDKFDVLIGFWGRKRNVREGKGKI